MAIEETRGLIHETRHKWLVLLAVCINGFMVVLDGSILNIAFPTLTRIFETEPTVILWVTVSSSLVTAGLIPIFGRTGDMYGRKKFFVLGFIIFTVGLVLCSLSQNVIQLILFRVVQAFGSAMNAALGFAIVTAAFPDRERGKALGILAAAFAAGPLMGPALGGFILDKFDWRAIFYLRVPVCIIGIALNWVLLEEQKVSNASPKIDFWGAATLFGGLACLTLFFNLGGRLGFASPPVLILFTGAVLLLALFILQERKTQNPVVDLNLFKIRLFTLGNVGLAVQALTISSQAFLLPFYLISGVGYSSLESGMLLSIPAVITLVIAPLSGWLSDKVGSRPLCVAGMTLLCLSLILFSRLGADASRIDIMLRLALFGIGSGLFATPNTSMIMGAPPKDKLGTASAVRSSVYAIAMSSGIAIVGTILASRQAFHAAELASDNLAPTVLERLSLIGGYRDAILVVAIICAIGIFTSLVSAKKHQEQ